jgi:hypothetical protein
MADEIKNPPSRRTRAPASREEFLEVGRGMLRSGQCRTPADVKLGLVVKAVGKTTGSAYYIWDDQTHYQADLARYVIDRDAFDGTGVISARAIRALERHEPVDEVIRLGAEAFVQQQIASGGFDIFLRYWGATAGDDAMVSDVRAGYVRYHEEFRALYVGLMDAYALRPRKPYNADDITISIAMAAEGYQLRIVGEPSRGKRRIRHTGPDGKAKQWTLLACMISALITEMCEPIPTPPTHP